MFPKYVTRRAGKEAERKLEKITNDTSLTKNIIALKYMGFKGYFLLLKNAPFTSYEGWMCLS